MSREPILIGHAVTKYFRGLAAIESVDFEIPPGAIYGLIGPNGAGKSTLFNLITGYHVPSGGDILFDGALLNGTPPYRVNQMGIARAFQISKPFPALTVEENVRVGAMFGRPGERDVAGVARDALSVVGLQEVAQQRARGLTVGILRKLEIARALATRPRILLADEPCAGLNPTETGEMLTCLKSVQERGIGVWLVEHDMRAVMKVCERVIVLDAGRKIAEGTPRDVVENREVIEAYLGSEAVEEIIS